MDIGKVAELHTSTPGWTIDDYQSCSSPLRIDYDAAANISDLSFLNRIKGIQFVASTSD